MSSRWITAQAHYVYGVVPVKTSLGRGTKGIADAEVGRVDFKSIAALTSPIVETNVRARRRDLLTHSEVLTTALEQGPVLPVQFGTVFENEEAVVSRFLAPRLDELQKLLAELEERVELRVTAFYIEEAILGEIIRDNPRVARLREATRSVSEAATFAGRIELGDLVATELRSRADRDAQAILGRLRDLAIDYEVDPEPIEHQVLRASFLVDRLRVADFDDAMNDIARHQDGRMRFKYLGPLPPHSFVSLGALTWDC